MKRQVQTAAVALTMGLALTACGSPASSSGSSGGSGGSSGSGSVIKVALIPPTSGALAQYGTDATHGWQVAVDEVNAKGGIDGHKVQLDIKATDADPATTLRVAKEATTQGGATFLGSVMTSPENAALNAQLGGMGALSFNALGKDDPLIGQQCSASAFHIVQTSGMDISALANQIGKLPGTKWAIQAVDYATGHTAAAQFKAAAEAAGKQVVLQQFAPLGSTDFGSYITKIKDSGADALFAVEYGADGVAFVKQATQFSLPATVKTVLGFNMVSEPLFKVLGPGIVGFYNNVGYDVSTSNALNQTFVKDYTAKYGSAPYYVPADNYLAAETLFAGIHKAGSIAPAAVAKALGDLSFDSIVGTVTMRGADHQLLRPSYLGKVEGSGTNLSFKIISSAAATVTTPKPSPDCKL